MIVSRDITFDDTNDSLCTEDAEIEYSDFDTLASLKIQKLMAASKFLRSPLQNCQTRNARTMMKRLRNPFPTRKIPLAMKYSKL